MPDNAAIVIAGISMLGTLFVTLITIYSNRNKTAADIRAVDANTYQQLVQAVGGMTEELGGYRFQLNEVRQRVRVLEEERASMQAHIKDLEEGNVQLTSRVRALEQENTQLTSRVRALEQENRQLRDENRRLKGEKNGD